MAKKNPTLPETHFLVETAWEVANQVGGIYTVIRSKVPEAISKWGSHYCLLGPYVESNAISDFEAQELPDSPLGRAITKCQKDGLNVYYGKWLVSGRPTTVLLDYQGIYSQIDQIKYYFWESHQLDLLESDALRDDVLAFGFMANLFLKHLADELKAEKLKLIAHFHEWMGAAALPDIKKAKLPIKTVFTTHATMLGRYLAMNDDRFYQNLTQYDWEAEATRFGIATRVRLERLCAHDADVFSVVSDVTGKECTYLLGRSPDLVTPNGLNIERFSVIHQVQNLHHKHKRTLEHFIMGHFFQSYSFDLNNTLYFFTSGRFEYFNKGYDLTLEALAKLNKKMIASKTPLTVVMFVVTRQPTTSINADVLNSRAMLKEIEHNCEMILRQIKEHLYIEAASGETDHRLPELNSLVDDYWKLRYRRTIQSWKNNKLPKVLTHNLIDPVNDPLLNRATQLGLVNKKEDKVKLVYHPDFISSTNPLFGMDYGQFVRACHLGIFPSHYEPWGYTPLECLARGVAAVTSDVSGFGDYLRNTPLGDEEHGAFLVERLNKTFDQSAEALANLMFKFISKTSRSRIDMRNKSEDLSESFDWKNLYPHYMKAYRK